MPTLEPTAEYKLKLSNVLLSVLTFIAIISALKASYTVTMPLAFALFLIILARPLQKRLSKWAPQKLAYSLTLLAMLLILGVFVGLLAYSGKQVADAAPKYAGQATEMWQKARQQAASQGVTLPENPRDMLHGGSGSGRGSAVAHGLLSMVSLWLLVIGLIILGLHEAPKFREKLHRGEGPEKSNDLVPVVEQVIDKCGRYFMVRTVVSGIQGMCSWGVALALGLDLAFIWGLSAALLNYIPTVGSLISVVPPTLFALFQFHDVGRAAIVFAAMCGIQVVLGIIVDPVLQGRQMQISSFLVLFSIAFWGWVWGVAGALIGVPLTVTILLFCAHFPGTKWISDLLTEGGEKEETAQKDAAKQPYHA
jgi:predicted PurR-regulated permease PerM